MNTVSLRAYAKINLSLDVVGRREDGYHLLESVFQGISLYDEVRVRRETGSGGIRIRCTPAFIPTDERNIAYKAAAAFFRAVGIERYQITIDLRKKIPSGAGLGGGSADSAAVFSALCRLYHRPFSTEAAAAVLLPLGADIPFFLYSGTMLAQGIGEILTPAPPLPDCFIVVAKPRAGANTKKIFSRLAEAGSPAHPDTQAVLRALQNRDLALLAAAAGNVLENATIPLCPKIALLKDVLKQEGAALALMTGSGSAVFGIFEKEKTARRAMKALLPHTRTVFLTRPVCRPMRTE